MAAAAKFPAALLQLLADMGGTMPGRPNTELTLNADVLQATVAPFSLVVNEAIPAAWDQIGYLTVESEVLHHSAYNAGTKTFTIDARAQDGTAAALHSAGVRVGKWLTAQQWNQIVADVIALETQLLGGMLNPNLVLNSDFGRRTVFGLAMPEVFADTAGLTVVSGSGGVAGNVYTTTAINTEIAWCNGAFVWRDGRASFTWQAVSTTDRESLFWKIDTNNFIELRQSGGTLTLRKTIGGVDTQIATVANALTVNRFYWGELDKQGTTVNIRFYDTLGTVAGVTKAASTEVTAARLTGTIADAAVQVGATISVFTATNGGKFGGIAASPGGVYVETWLPESWTASSVFTGTLGGQAIGYDEAVDVGPLGKQWAIRGYVPATSRTITIDQWQTVNASNVVPSAAYTTSFYIKTSGKGGAGNLVQSDVFTYDTAQGNFGAPFAAVADAAEAAWTRKSATASIGATARVFRQQIRFNAGNTATGTAWVMLPQLEQGSAATAWRNAPEDASGLIGEVISSGADLTTTSAAFVDADPRDLSMNFFFPRDCQVLIESSIVSRHTVATALNTFTFSIDGVAEPAITFDAIAATGSDQPIYVAKRKSLTAGKHLIKLQWKTNGGATATIRAASSLANLRVTAFPGK